MFPLFFLFILKLRFLSAACSYPGGAFKESTLIAGQWYYKIIFVKAFLQPCFITDLVKDRPQVLRLIFKLYIGLYKSYMTIRKVFGMSSFGWQG